MEPICQECKQKAEFVCFCNDSYMCKGCREAHRKRFKGPHKIILCNDPDLENIRLSFKNPKGKSGKNEEVKKKVEDSPALLEEKKVLKDKIKAEVLKVEEFKTNLVNSVTKKATGMVQGVIFKYSAELQEFNEACKAKENNLLEALEYLNTNEDISGNLLLCKLLDFRDLANTNLLELKSIIKEEKVSLDNTLILRVELIKSQENSQVSEYFSTTKDPILPPLKSLFEEVLSERHEIRSSIKLLKFPLVRESLTQLSLLLPLFSSLKILQLSENDLGIEGLKKLGPVLPKLQSLKKLSVTKNNLKGPGCKVLAQYLKDLKELVNLDLSGNKMGSEGLKPICLSLQNLVKLKSLKLMNNSLSSESSNYLISCLPNLKKLGVLRLTGNNINAEQQGLIEEHATNNCNVKF